jgi:hypothetical protein
MMRGGTPDVGALRELSMMEWLDLMRGFDLESARTNSADVYRAARLALLKIRAEKTFERTDTLAQEVEEALAEAAARLRDPMRSFGTKSRGVH